MQSTNILRLEPDQLRGSNSCPTPLVMALMIACSGGAAIATLLTNSKPWFVPALCIGTVYLILIFLRLEFGTYLLLGAAIFFDQYGVGGIQSRYVSKSLKFFQNLNNFPNPVPPQLGPLHNMSEQVLSKLAVNPVELLMVLMVGIFIFRAAISRKVAFRPIPNMGIAILFLLMLIFFTGYGLIRPGGNWKVAMWEIRPLYYLCLTYFLSTQTIRNHRQVKTCVWIIIVGLSFRGLQGCWRFFVTLRGQLGELRAIMGHEDSLFLVTGFLLLTAFFFLKYRGPEFYVLLLTALPCFITFLVNQRRVAFGVLGICMMALVLLLPKWHFFRSLRVAIPAVLFIMVYTAAFWNGTGLKAMPARKIKSIFVSEENSEDSASNLWRELELVNLKATVRAHPEGIGFGQKFLMVVPYANIERFFPLWDYIPHCAIYWVWVKTGFVGFTIFWLFFGVAIAQAMVDYRAIVSPYYKALAMMVVLFIAGQIIIAYYDLQITYFRNMIYLGIAMGISTVLRDLDPEALPRDNPHPRNDEPQTRCTDAQDT